MRLRPVLQWTGQNLKPAFPSQKGKPNTGSFAWKRWVKLRAGRWLKRVSVSYPYNPCNYHIARNLSRHKKGFFIFRRNLTLPPERELSQLAAGSYEKNH
jgi:hypothetical protein